MTDLKALYTNLTAKLKATYTSGITMDEAEKLAAEFLHAQLLLAAELEKYDLDQRMRKSGVKAVRAAIYMEAATKSDKKPSDSFLQNLVDLNELVQTEQRSFDDAEASYDSLQNYFNIFREAHIYYRGIAKGRFE